MSNPTGTCQVGTSTNPKRSHYRYVYTESLGRWHTADLFIGLAYLSHREALEYPARDIALRGRPISFEQTPDATHALLVREG